VADLGGRDPAIDAELTAIRQELDERVRLLSSLPSRMSTLEGSVASLAGVSEGARDAWILAESEYYMQIANAQLQLANNPHLAALALKMADERIVQLANPALTDVRRALSDELAALDIMEKPDIEGATLTLASLAKVVESLPLASAAAAEEETGEIDPELSAAGRAWASVKNAMSGLVKVTPPEQARLVALSPDGEFFLRSNIALQLQAARLALLRGEQAIFEQSLADSSALLSAYFDTDSSQVIGAQETIAEIRGHVFATAVPNISESLQLLRQFRTLNETAQ
jgi:uroporphyrin-3 C-methyltransferase